MSSQLGAFLIELNFLVYVELLLHLSFHKKKVFFLINEIPSFTLFIYITKDCAWVSHLKRITFHSKFSVGVKIPLVKHTHTYKQPRWITLLTPSELQYEENLILSVHHLWNLCMNSSCCWGNKWEMKESFGVSF